MPPFLEVHHLAENNNIFAVWTVPDSELSSALGTDWPRSFRIEPALSVTALTLKKIRGVHAVHFSPAATDSAWSLRQSGDAGPLAKVRKHPEHGHFGRFRRAIHHQLPGAHPLAVGALCRRRSDRCQQGGPPECGFSPTGFAYSNHRHTYFITTNLQRVTVMSLVMAGRRARRSDFVF